MDHKSASAKTNDVAVNALSKELKSVKTKFDSLAKQVKDAKGKPPRQNRSGGGGQGRWGGRGGRGGQGGRAGGGDNSAKRKRSPTPSSPEEEEQFCFRFNSKSKSLILSRLYLSSRITLQAVARQSTPERAAPGRAVSTPTSVTTSSRTGRGAEAATAGGSVLTKPAGPVLSNVFLPVTLLYQTQGKELSCPCYCIDILYFLFTYQ